MRINPKIFTKSRFYILLFIGFIFLSILFNYNKITNLVKEPHQKKDEITVKQKQKRISVLDAIVHAKLLLGISDDNSNNHLLKDDIYISYGIDRSEMDLNYANIIITNQVELAKGKLISGIEKNNGNKQVLEFYGSPIFSEYFITLYYTKEMIKESDKTQLAIIVDDFGY